MSSSCLRAPNLHASVPAVVISEFMAVNESTLTDEDGDYSDWIEIHNRGPAEVDLDGWYLTDDRTNPIKWQLPEITLPSRGYLLVFASGKDRAIANSELHASFRLSAGGEYLALVKSDGLTVAWEYALSSPRHFKDVSYGLILQSQARYLTAPTPGTVNDSVAENTGPIIRDVDHVPDRPAADEPIVVKATLQEGHAAISAVILHCRIMHRATHPVPMFDDGAHEDSGAGDGVYGAIIPNGMYRPGDMVRYYITATDGQGQISRWPLYQEPADAPAYYGTVIADPSVSSRLPVLYWFVADPAAAETGEGARASIFYDGIFYDNVLVRLRGHTARYWPKKSLKFDLNHGHYFQYAPDQAPVEEFNLDSAVTDKSYMRSLLAWQTYRDAGVPASISFPVRVQQNGAFYGVLVFVEQPDERYMARQGLDPRGALYKMMPRNTLESSTKNVVKRTRLDEDYGDLQELIDGLALPSEERTRYLFDHVNIPEVINYLAVATILHDRDHGDNNYYMYRDTEGTGEWTVLPWDKDMTFGRTYLPDQGGTFNDVIWADRDPESHPLQSYYVGNRLFDALYDTPAIQEMYLRRLRTVMDTFLQPADTPIANRYYERRIEQLYAQMHPDVALDIERWTPAWGKPQTFAQATDIIKTSYLAARREHLYSTHSAARGGIIPNAQEEKTGVYLSDLEFNPVSGDQDQEYFTLVNPTTHAVDISGWQVVYDVEYTFAQGVIIPAGGTLYVSPNIVSFRNRDRSPTGGEGLFVQGNYRGRLSNTWGILKLYNVDKKLVTLKVFFNRGPSR